MRLEVLTLNIQHGLHGSTGQQTRADELAAAVSECSVDVVALQEVDRGQPRSHGADQARIIADALGFEHVRFAATLTGDVRRGSRAGMIPYRSGGHPGPAYGLAIVSRYPILAWFTAPLPRIPILLPTVRGGRLARWEDEPRALLAAVIQTPIGPVAVCSTHLSLAAAVAAVQLPRVVRALGALGGATGQRLIACGDFNLDRPWVERIARGFEIPRALSFPAQQPRRQLDHVLVRGGRVASVTATRFTISDHQGVRVGINFTA